jgi:hypothetical protein
MNPTPEEAKAITAGSIAYFGTYTVDEAAKTVVLRIDSSTLANQLGVDQKRIVNSITADEMKMTNPTSVAGNVISYTFNRAK